MSSVVRIERVFKEYLLGEQIVQALNDITLAIEPGVFLAISGPSGSGKTTMLNLIGCIDRPSSGNIYINEENVSQKSANELADLRARSIGFIFQTFNLLPVLSAAENVEYPLLRRKDVSPEDRKRRVDYFLDIVGLSKYANNRPNQLSGGQRQRVAIARALVVKPAIVLADEPTANLDKATGIEILKLMKKINEHLGTTFIFSTHDQKVIDHANRLVKVEDGTIKAFGIRGPKNNWNIARVRNLSDIAAENIPE
ncbi:ABC transporter ATP-binding protein [Dechloromonas denitrificans]|uniref:ABC transporter ATP-binding protein n=1 Tax=Azonexaceae TaxID=2008795 RepID=UPI001CF8C3BC|nr:ABC transporter ATP-binding protein [Dechloromonas denitrificans]UCV01911.1 ABC transporter ATP-binding protein [Dechloromonas denitrificans]UCV06245.1 ABC transporter ATP-binding protein [Dechloromonas denitrificans]